MSYLIRPQRLDVGRHAVWYWWDDIAFRHRLACGCASLSLVPEAVNSPKELQRVAAIWLQGACPRQLAEAVRIGQAV